MLVLFLLSACAGGKRSNKDSLLSRAYHDITARDNGYFNAKLLLAYSAETLWESQEDDFSEVLPVFKFGRKENAQGEQANLDEVIKKSSIVIQLHDDSKWVDDSYLLIGQAQFYKRDFDQAITSFQYIISQYENGPPGRKKKKGRKKGKKRRKKKDKDEGLLANVKHQPVAKEASLWIIKSLLEQEAYSDAKAALSAIKSDEKFPKQLLDELYATEAHLYMKQDQDAQAIEALQLAVEHTKDTGQVPARVSHVDIKRDRFVFGLLNHMH